MRTVRLLLYHQKSAKVGLVLNNDVHQYIRIKDNHYNLNSCVICNSRTTCIYLVLFIYLFYNLCILQDYMRRKIDLVYNTVNGFSVTENDEHGVILTRWIVTRAACNMEHVTCNNDGSDVLQQWVAQSDPDNNNP